MATYTIDKQAIASLFDESAKKSGYAKEYALEKAKLVQDTLMKFAQEKIDKFYDDYEPHGKHHYERTNNIHDNAVRPYMEDHGSYIEAGVKFSTEHMLPYKAQSNDYHFMYLYPERHLGNKPSDIRNYDIREPVLVNTMLYGVHGNSKWLWGNPPTSQSAFLLTEEYASSSSFLSTVGLV